MAKQSADFRMMPMVGGPIRDGLVGQHYRRRETLAIQYKSTPEAVAALLPGCFTPADPPVVTFSAVYCDGVDLLAGRGYRIGTVMLAARFDGENEQLQGNYILVMFEDSVWGIVTGREVLGIPKLYADFSSLIILPDGRIRSELSMWGHFLFGIEVGPLQQQDAPVVARVNAQAPLPYLAYKFIPSLEGPPDAAYPTVTPSDVTVNEVWLGTSGRVYFGDVGQEGTETTPVTAHMKRIVDAVKSLPMQEFISASRSLGSTVLRVDLARRLSERSRSSAAPAL